MAKRELSMLRRRGPTRQRCSAFTASWHDNWSRERPADWELAERAPSHACRRLFGEACQSGWPAAPEAITCRIATPRGRRSSAGLAAPPRHRRRPPVSSLLKPFMFIIRCRAAPVVLFSHLGRGAAVTGGGRPRTLVAPPAAADHPSHAQGNQTTGRACEPPPCIADLRAQKFPRRAVCGRLLDISVCFSADCSGDRMGKVRGHGRAPPAVTPPADRQADRQTDRQAAGRPRPPVVTSAVCRRQAV